MITVSPVRPPAEGKLEALRQRAAAERREAEFWHQLLEQGEYSIRVLDLNAEEARWIHEFMVKAMTSPTRVHTLHSGTRVRIKFDDTCDEVSILRVVDFGTRIMAGVTLEVV